MKEGMKAKGSRGASKIVQLRLDFTPLEWHTLAQR